MSSALYHTSATQRFLGHPSQRRQHMGAGVDGGSTISLGGLPNTRSALCTYRQPQPTSLAPAWPGSSRFRSRRYRRLKATPEPALHPTLPVLHESTATLQFGCCILRWHIGSAYISQHRRKGYVALMSICVNGHYLDFVGSMGTPQERVGSDQSVRT